MAYHFPPPTSWEAFEDLCCDLFRELWKAPMTQKNGRSGQPQAGVDVFGLPEGGAEWFGVQCKKKLDAPLTREELEEEVEKAKGFNPTLTRYILATTAKRDKNAQEWARELTEASTFEVTVYAWDDFCEALSNRPELVRRHFGSLVLPSGPEVATNDSAVALDAFRRRHWAKLLPLPSLAQARGQSRADLLLTDIYTALDVKALVQVYRTSGEGTSRAGTETHSSFANLPGDLTYVEALLAHEQTKIDAIESKHPPEQRHRRCRALEAAAANRRLVLVGAAGCGKSTFGRFLAACLLGESLGQNEANLRALGGEVDTGFDPWPHGAPLAIFLSLARFQASDSFPAEGEAGEAKHLMRYLEQLGPEASRQAFARGLEEALARDNGALLILDGLDETPSAETRRVKLRQVICGFTRAYSTCRVIVTSRPYAYKTNSPWRLDDADFQSVDLAPFDNDQQKTFVEAWYRRLVSRQLLTVTEERRGEMVANLVGQIQGTSYLTPLAESPLMLTMMADLHASNSGRLPAGGRAALYKESIELLLDRWNETRDGTKPTEALDMTLEQIQEALQKLAFEVHRSRGVSDAETPEIRRSELWEALVDTRKAYGHEGSADDMRIMDYLHQRSGILIGESEEIYRFPHRSYQEYLAATYLVEANEFPDPLEEVVGEDPALWREVVQLAVGQTAKQKSMAWAIVEMLVPKPPPEAPSTKDPAFYRATLAGLAIRETGLWQAASEANQGKLERVRRWLQRAVELGAMEIQDRAQAGQVLGLLGDQRPGVGLGADGLPRFEWVEIPSGSFTMGGEAYGDEKPVHEETVEAFKISRYPLTNQQYQAFVDDGGYSESWRHCWTKAGWEWRRKEKIDKPWPSGFPYDLPNHPRVSISWYEAVAYCRWLSEKTGTPYRLPGEAEWERAARGIDGREYPWGTDFDLKRGNFFETKIGTTTAVGMFPGGESPPGSNKLGILDASGNVWEWCSTKWRNNYEEEADEDLEDSAVRVLRGGSFANDGISARCAARFRYDPDSFYRSFGLRLVAPI